MKKIIALNYKNFAQALGAEGLRLTEAARDAANRHGLADVIVCPPTPFLSEHARLASQNLWIFAQHADANELGQCTGAIPLESIKKAGCEGTLVNHAEKKLPHEALAKTIARANELGLKTIACADSLQEGKELARMKPWAIAVEPPELIGTGISVSTAKPEVVKGAVAEIKHLNSEVRVLVGAGVSNAEDVRRAVELGAEGVLLASAFVKAAEPKTVLGEMLEALR